MFVPTFQPKSKLKKGRRGEKSPSKQPFLLKILGKKEGHHDHSCFLADELWGEVFQQPDVLFGRGAKPGRTIPHHFYPIANFHILGRAKIAVYIRHQPVEKVSCRTLREEKHQKSNLLLATANLNIFAEIL